MTSLGNRFGSIPHFETWHGIRREGAVCYRGCLALLTVVALLSLPKMLLAEEVDFDTEVIPLLTRFGCNSGACHGATAGRGHFRLSLFGARPADDYAMMTAQLEGRRVNVVHPDRSLLLLKPTTEVHHEGGERFASDSSTAMLLNRWISEGAQRQGTRSLRSWRVIATPVVATAEAGSAELTSRAHFDNGESADVTTVTLFTAHDPDAVQVTADGRVSLSRPGRHVIIARYLDQVTAVELLLPFADKPPDTSQFSSITRAARDAETANLIRTSDQIDAAIDDRLRLLNIAIGPPSSDDEFRRRAWLDLAGRLPPVDVIREGARRPLDRTQLIIELTDTPQFADVWTYRILRWLQLDQLRDVATAKSVRDWLHAQLSARASWRAIVEELLLAEGDPTINGAAAFHLLRPDARLQAEHVTEVLAGIRLRCANCHDHPLDRWTQDDYHGLAAIFAGVQRFPVVKFTSRGTVVHPATGLSATPRVPGMKQLPREQDQRRDVLAWLLDDQQSVLAKNTANRLWQMLTGRGLCDPVDDRRATNPPTNAAVLDALTQQLLSSDYDLRPVIRTICLTSAYGRSSRLTSSALTNARQSQIAVELNARAARRTLEPEVLLDAISDATGIPELFDGHNSKTRAVELSGPVTRTGSLALLKSCPVAGERCELVRAEGSLDVPQYLGLIHGGLINDRLRDSRSVLVRQHSESTELATRVQELYLRTLSREPTAAERDAWLHELESVSSSDERLLILEDLLWSLLVCEEFLTCG